ncbi:MAG: RnfABCDGE type electron transport complex subunit B [Omnitrophica bacterium]|nr:RnfABCDGE type electron transport complex subunit B [Candidatus Omnitrophota bacterium]
MGNTIVTSILSMAGLGFFFASLLAFVNQKLAVKEDPKIGKIEEALPGINCGACGYTSCHLYAEALAKGEANPAECKAGGDSVSGLLSGILGVAVEKRTKQIALVHCGADGSVRKKKAVYFGINTCAAANNVSGGENLCGYSCFGYGDCMRVCPFGAIEMKDALPRIDKEKCTACGKCVLACPRDIITVEKIAAKNFIFVTCNNPERGPDTRKACSVGCIACGLCQKFTGGVFHVENNLALVKYDNMARISNTEEVRGKCPTKCIARL